jgi:hypothetical protein
MLTRRTFLGSAAATLSLPLLPHAAAAQTLCEVWSQTMLWDARHALWGTSHPQGPAARVVYALAAPWCPYTQQVVRDYVDGPGDFELRIVPMDAKQNMHRDMQADIVLNNFDGIKRTFIDRVAHQSISADMRKRIHDANCIAQLGIGERFTTELTWPALIYEGSQGANSYTGYMNLTEIVDRLVPIDYTVTNFAADLEAMAAAETRLNKTRVKLGYLSAIHALPDDRSASAPCVAKGLEYEAIASVTWNGHDWVRVQAFTTAENELVNGYIMARDLV